MQLLFPNNYDNNYDNNNCNSSYSSYFAIIILRWFSCESWSLPMRMLKEVEGRGSREAGKYDFNKENEEEKKQKKQKGKKVK